MTNIQTTLENYKFLGELFAPEYEQDNKVLNDFKANNPKLSSKQVAELVDLLKSNNDIAEKYFVADLLYLYDRFDQELLEPLLLTAINYKDPSFNRIFLRPCITAFGIKRVSDFLGDKFRNANVEERIGITNLLYWLRPQENGDADNLMAAILERANTTSNLIERYHYKLQFPDKIKDCDKIPNNAEELINAIKGNEEYEYLLFNKLEWARNNVY